MRRGFTLIELSVVLVLVGLLVGGFMGAKELVRASELRSVVTEFNNFRTAFNNFDEKYQQHAGDITNATQYWGALDASPVGDGDGLGADCWQRNYLFSSGGATCNGDGSGRYEQIAGDALYQTIPEAWRAWQHLALAGLITGRYAGRSLSATVATPAVGGSVPAGGTANLPTGRIRNAVWTLRSMIAPNNWTDIYPGDYEIALWYGGLQPNPGGYVNATPVFTGAEAWQIDKKIDDARPGTGNVRGEKSAATCVSTTDPATAEYLTTSSDLTCILMMGVVQIR